MSDRSVHLAAPLPDPTAAPSCAELLRAAAGEAGGWDALAARVPVDPRTGLRRPGVARLKQMASDRGVRRISGPDTLDGLAAACAGLPSGRSMTVDRWVAAQRETLRRSGLEGTARPRREGVASLPTVRRQTRLERELQRTLAGTDTAGLTGDQVETVTSLITHFAATARRRRGA